ncbi:MAG: ThiF family adenylyltransferase [Clostridiales bacterium]|jgi:molybdopterin/thiamine biosynthesis adenylyltransferase/predicted RNA-binding Zn-ribbon protein involved in translation (DUF1610 family)|nr:ThiF family adenylyltransferase [Clostridiales bacterium]
MDNRDIFDFAAFTEIEKYQSKKILLLGAGAVGANIMLTLLLMGFKDITVLDFDKVEAHNCSRAAGLFLPDRDTGKYKADVLRDYALSWGAKSESLICDVRDLGKHFFRSFGAVLVALDNMEAVCSVGAAIAGSGILTLRAATNEYNYSVEVFDNNSDACLCCWRGDVSMDTRVTGCGEKYTAEMAAGKAPALQVSSAMAANRLVGILVQTLGGNVMHINARYYDSFNALHKFPILRDENCPFHEKETKSAKILSGSVFTVTAGQILSHLKEETSAAHTVVCHDDFVLEFTCRNCGMSEPVLKPLRKVSSPAACKNCGGIRNAKTLNTISENTPKHVLNLTLWEIGFRCCDDIYFYNELQEIFFCKFEEDFLKLRENTLL